MIQEPRHGKSVKYRLNNSFHSSEIHNSGLIKVVVSLILVVVLSDPFERFCRPQIMFFLHVHHYPGISNV